MLQSDQVLEYDDSCISGFGIGLYIVAEILKYHDSKVEAESELCIGSTFSFWSVRKTCVAHYYSVNLHNRHP